jgi:hypothetical protein
MAAERLARLLGISFPPPRAVPRSLTSHRVLRLGFALVSLVILSAAASGTATAATAKAKSCAKQVVADWYDDGRVDKIYPLECYREAIKSLPPDVIDYSNAKEEIGRALAYAKQGKPDPGGEDPTPPTTSTGTGPTGTGTTETGKTGTDATGTGTTPADAVTQTATQETDTSGPSSVPIPLLVLGGLAVLLLAAGSASYLRRRMNGGNGGDGTPPAAA